MWLGDPKLRPVFEEFNRRSAVVYVHPNNVPCWTLLGLTAEQGYAPAAARNNLTD